MSKVARTAWRVLGKVITETHAAIYRASCGKVAGQMFNSPVLLLTTTGRNTGKERTTLLMYIGVEQDLVIIASNGGAPYHPVWYLNFRANPGARVMVQAWNLRVTSEEASGRRGAGSLPRRDVPPDTRTTSGARNARSPSSCTPQVRR